LGASAATQAPPGTFVANAGATTATIDPLGSYTNVAGATAAILAPPGTYVGTTGATAPTAAPPGFYDPGFGNTAPIPIPTVAWANPVSGNWQTAADWTGGTVPGQFTNADISVAGTYKVTDTQSTTTIYDLSVGAGATLQIAAGTFTVNGTADNAGTVNVTGASTTLVLDRGATDTGTLSVRAGATIDLAGGDLSGGTVGILAGATLAATSATLTTISDATLLDNKGTLLASGAGGLNIAGGLKNSGTIAASGGDLTIGGPLTGTGQSEIFSGNTMEFGAAARAAVIFENDHGDSGLLKLDASRSFSGTVSGLALGDGIDLVDLPFSGGPSLKVTGTAAAGTTTNVTIKDGATSVTLHLVNAIAGEFPINPNAYALSPDGNSPTQGTVFQLAAPAT
jgi:hypothetical protein